MDSKQFRDFPLQKVDIDRYPESGRCYAVKQSGTVEAYGFHL